MDGLAQGAELMGSYGINVPPGIAIQSLSEMDSAAEKMKDEANEVNSGVW